MKERVEVGWMVLISLILVTGTVFGAGITAGEEDGDEVDFELVQGYFTEISFSGDQDQTVIEISHQEENISYDFSHTGGEWSGDTEYLDEEATSYSEEDGEWILSIALDHDAPVDDEWEMVIDGQEHELRVLEADTGLGKSGSLEFSLQPHTDQAVASDSFEMVNNGNVPSTFEVEYEMDDLDYSLESYVVEPEGSEEITFEFTADTYDPEIFDLQDISISVYSLGRLDLEAEGNVVVGSEIGYTETPTVNVGYEGFERDEGDGFLIQFEETIEVPGDATGTTTFYVYPDEELYIDLEGENVTFDEDDVNINVGEVDLDFDPTEPISPNHDEVEITVTFTSDYEEGGWIELEVGREVHRTEILLTETVEPPEDEEGTFSEEQQERLYLGAIIVLAVIVFIVFRSGLVQQLKSEEEKEDES